MLVYFIVIIITGTNLGTNAEPVTVDITVGNHRTCTPDDIVVFAGEPLIINIEHKHLRDISDAFCTSKHESVVFLSTFTHVAPRGRLMIHNITQYMGRKWTCKFTIESEEHFSCHLAVRYRNRNEAVVLINNEVLYINPNNNTKVHDYDAVGHYDFNDKDFITIKCRNQPVERREFRYTMLKHYDSKGELIKKVDKKEDQNDAILELKLEYYNDYDYFECHANGYKTAVILYRKEPAVNPSIRGSTHTSPPESTTKRTVHTTSHFPITSSAPATTSDRVDPDKEAASQINPWLLAALCCGASVALVLAACYTTQYVLRLIKHKRCNPEVNYENISTTDSALPHPKQWNEPIYAEPVYQQSETSSPHYQNNLEILYTKPISKKDRQKITNLNNEYAEVIDTNEAFGNNYADIDHDINTRTGLGANKATYSEVTQWKDPTIDKKYDNVFENGRYVNAHDRTEYVEPAYCAVNTHK